MTSDTNEPTPTLSTSDHSNMSPTRGFGSKEEKERVIKYNSPKKESRDSISSHPLHKQMIINKLNPIKKDFLNFVESAQGSVSQLSFSVNDAAAGKPFNECYEKQEMLGEGGFAVVYRCYHHERQHTYAVKEILQESYECSGENLKEEIDSLKRLREVPYIVRLHDVFYETEICYLVMEEMRGGDLLDRLCEIEVYDEAEARKTSRRLLEAIYYCHKKNIVHRDIKPENILLASKENNTVIKLADFGCARRFEPGTTNLCTLCGSPQYVAPELYTNEGGYDERCDLWSAAVVIYVILGGYAPFDAEDHELPSIICEGYFEFHDKYWENISEEPKDLIRSLLKVDAQERATLEEALDSEWLRRRDKELIRKSNMEGSLSSFDAWCHSQNSGFGGDSSFRSLNSSRHSVKYPMTETHEEEEDEGGSQGSIAPLDLL
jgi:serine/threonine protein kinase